MFGGYKQRIKSYLINQLLARIFNIILNYKKNQLLQPYYMC